LAERGLFFNSVRVGGVWLVVQERLCGWPTGVVKMRPSAGLFGLTAILVWRLAAVWAVDKLDMGNVSFAVLFVKD